MAEEATAELRSWALAMGKSREAKSSRLLNTAALRELAREASGAARGRRASWRSGLKLETGADGAREANGADGMFRKTPCNGIEPASKAPQAQEHFSIAEKKRKQIKRMGAKFSDGS